ncbi:MAG TPA: endonuclease/exonuclease/phosphatase family protein [Pyrinomonadaceae bacterium]|nr:endonuclease/exonuclease/phosphatase family protein [Pyrinomonadaceae bacterium]
MQALFLRAALLPLLLLQAVSPAPVAGRTGAAGRPPALTYDELLTLYDRETPPEPLRRKLQSLLTTPFVSNEATERGTRPAAPRSERLGRFLRVVQWNVERGLEYEAIEAAFVSPHRFAELIDGADYRPGSPARAAALEQAAMLQAADIVVLNEVDWGLKRTGYRNVAADLAAALGMNYAFGVEFVEVDPIALGIEKFTGEEAGGDKALAEQIRVDPERYLGLHGTAILSRYPLENVRLVPFKFQGHDWYADERKGRSPLEKGRRKASEVAFRTKTGREVRRGGRMMLLADISDPAFPGGRLTVVATHLEAKTKPANRVRQLREVLDEIAGVRHAVVLAGDMNTSTRDDTPTSLAREFKKRLGSRKFWAEQLVKHTTGFTLPFGFVRGGINHYRKQGDPTVRHVPFVAANPEAKFFTELKEFRFADGGAFDFRGDEDRSSGTAGTLSNSNERGGKGFATTYEVERAIGFVGKFKLDWIFVKPPVSPAGEPGAGSQTYRFAPHFGRTLKELNFSFPDRISDHSPLLVDLPLEEPPRL